MGELIPEDVKCQRVNGADGFLLRLAIRHYAWQRRNLGDPATVILALDFNGEFYRHRFPFDFTQSGTPVWAVMVPFLSKTATYTLLDAANCQKAHIHP
jgi:hypothetical protein